MADDITATAPPVAEGTSDTKPTNTPDEQKTNRVALWLARIEASEKTKALKIPTWRDSISYRIGKPFGAASEHDRVQVPKDWQLVKSKQAQLFSQVPEVRLTEKHKEFAESVPTFAKKLNEWLCEARVGVAMDECLPDIINAAGFGSVLVSYQARMTPKAVPSVGQQTAAMMQAAGQKVPTRTIPMMTDSRLRIEHLPPDDVLVPDTFIGSDFDDSPWLGNAGRKPWSEAKSEFKLRDEQHDTVCGGESRDSNNRIQGGTETGDSTETDMVEYRQVFYWRYLFHPEEPNYKAIQRMVFVKGLDQPVIDEEWKGQRRTASGAIIGAVKLPIRIGTLTYVSNQAIPPSDSEMIRPQVNELNESRSQMIRNRRASVPVRWYNTNLVAQEVQTQLLRGTWQGMIPMNGDGSRAIGEVARAAYPREDFEFDRVASHDINETSQTEPTQGNAAGATAIRSASEAQIHQANFQTRVGYERSRMVKMFVGIAEVAAGLLALYGQWTPEEEQALSKWDRKTLANYYVYDVRADSTVLLDAAQLLDRHERFLNMTVKSGYVDPMPIIRKMAELSGIDPSVVRAPEQKRIDPANISIRLTAEDMRDPLMVAMLMEAGQMPKPETLEAAKRLLMAINAPPAAPQPPGGLGGEVPPSGAVDVPLAPSMAGVLGVGMMSPNEGTAPPVVEGHPGWNEASRVNKRRENGQ